jgi:hypothetical protein
VKQPARSLLQHHVLRSLVFERVLLAASAVRRFLPVSFALLGLLVLVSLALVSVSR